VHWVPYQEKEREKRGGEKRESPGSNDQIRKVPITFRRIITRGKGKKKGRDVFFPGGGPPGSISLGSRARQPVTRKKKEREKVKEKEQAAAGGAFRLASFIPL